MSSRDSREAGRENGLTLGPGGLIPHVDHSPEPWKRLIGFSLLSQWSV